MLKIADFGKSEMVGAEETKPYKGNMRYVPPEGKLSQKGDVYSSAMVLIRNVEEGLFKNGETTLLEPKGNDSKASPELRGVEKFVVEHKDFLATNPGMSLTSLSRRGKLEDRTVAQRQDQSKALGEYIDKLEEKMKQENSGYTEEQATELCQLLKEMTHWDPNCRPTMEEVAQRYEGIMGKIENTTPSTDKR